MQRLNEPTFPTDVVLVCRDCGKSFELVLNLPAGVSPKTNTFQCRNCNPIGDQSEEKFAFDGPRLRGKATNQDGDVDPDGGYDSDDSRAEAEDSWLPRASEVDNFGWNKQRGRVWVPNGYQECKARRVRESIPIWVNNRSEFLRVVSSHPQARHFLKRWERVAYLFWNLQYSASQVAQQMKEEGFCEINTEVVKTTIRMLRKRAARLSTPQPDRDQDYRRAAKLLEQGFTVRQIADQLGCSVGKVGKLRKRWCSRKDSPFRPYGGRGKTSAVLPAVRPENENQGAECLEP